MADNYALKREWQQDGVVLRSLLSGGADEKER